jgi:Transposase, Mutator family
MSSETPAQRQRASFGTPQGVRPWSTTPYSTPRTTKKTSRPTASSDSAPRRILIPACNSLPRKALEAAYGAKFPKATAKITDDLDQLLVFYDYPAEHWVHLRTTNPSQPFATVRHRTKVTKGPGSRAAGLAMAFKLIQSAQDRWRAVKAPHVVALVRAEAHVEGGVLVERPEAAAA